MKANTSQIQRFLPAALALGCGIVYLFTLAPTFSHTDSGELAAVQHSLGVAHPTGYPLFTMLGWLFLRIPLSSSAVWQLNLLSLLYVSGGLYFFSKSLLLFFGQFKTRTKKKGKKGKKEEPASPAQLSPRALTANLLATAFGTLFLAFSHTFWMQSTSTEVYSLHILLLSLVLFCLLKAYYSPAEAERPWLWLAVALGLAFGNHRTIFLIIPGLALLYFYKFGLNRAAFLRVGKMLLVFFGVLVLLYAYLPIRAATDPQYNWGTPWNSKHFWYHFMGAQFQNWFFESWEASGAQLTKFIQGFPWEFTVGGLLLAIPGVGYSFRLSRRMARFLLLSFLFTVFFVIHYSIKDLEPYFLLAYFVTAFWIALGVRWIFLRAKVGAQARLALLGLCCVAMLGHAVYNFGRSNQHGLWLFEDYSRAALDSMEPDAILISHQWDFLISPAWYLQSVENFRSDVDILEYEMLRARHWYDDFMRRNNPELCERLQPEMAAFFPEMKKFAFGEVYDGRILSSTFDRLFKAIFTKNPDRPVYIAPEMLLSTFKRDGLGLPKGYSYVPGHYFYRVLPLSELQQYRPLAFVGDKIRFPGKEDYYTGVIRKQIGLVRADRATYELAYSHPEEARKWVKAALDIHPQIQLPTQLQSLR